MEQKLGLEKKVHVEFSFFVLLPVKAFSFRLYNLGCFLLTAVGSPAWQGLRDKTIIRSRQINEDN